MYEIILKKRNGGELDNSEIEYWINGCVDGSIPEYQSAALLMAIFFRGLNFRETTELTKTMENSGKVADLSEITGVKIDKHSTGGVGDKTTLILAPLVASTGISVAKMSGRGLGHTGGTIDKLTSIPGFSAEMTQQAFISQIKAIGLVIAAQSGNFVPADKMLYSLRDVTATVDNLSLIASSIMSKKLASGADAIVLDVKAGKGAFMKDLAAAKELASLMVGIGNKLKRRTVALITAMDQPIGMSVGNGLEVIEAIEILNDGGPEDLKELCFALGGEMLVLSGRTESYAEAESLLKNNIANGSAKSLFKKMIDAQRGDSRVVDNPDLIPMAGKRLAVKSDNAGYVIDCDAMKIGRGAMLLGAGREKKDSIIDLEAGIVLHKKTGDRVSSGETLATIHYNDSKMLDTAIDLIRQAFKVNVSKVGKTPIILGKIDS